MRLAILGATFDPVHNGHIQMAEYALDYSDYVLLIPTASPPHKDNSLITEEKFRYDMLCLAIMNNEKLVASDIEFKREGTTYTIDTLQQLISEYCNVEELLYIIGADTLFLLETWRNFEQVFKLCTFLVYPRAGFETKDILEKIEFFTTEYGAKIVYDNRKVYDISSTQIRDAVKQNSQEIERMINPEVCRYIKEHGIYKG